MSTSNDEERFRDELREVADALRKARHLRYAEEDVCALPGGLEMISFGFSTPTPWHTPRELAEDEIERRLEALANRLDDPEHAVFNVHCPPRGTHPRSAPRDYTKPDAAQAAYFSASFSTICTYQSAWL